MTMAGLVAFVGGAGLFSLAGTGGIWLLGRLLGRPPAPAGIAFAALTLFFLGLTHLPLPDPATMTCPRPWTDPLLTPFRFVTRLSEILAAPGRIRGELLAVGALAVLMNLMLLVAIGWAFARATGAGWGAALIFAAALPLAVELTQLTGVWGLWPCPWRQFDVDDLILNFSGVILGYGLARTGQRGKGAKDGGL